MYSVHLLQSLITIQCIHPIGETPTVKWFRGLVDVTTAPNYHSTCTDDGHISLHIPEVMEEDGGDFICQVTNNAGKASCVAELIVQSKAKTRQLRLSLTLLHCYTFTVAMNSLTLLYFLIHVVFMSAIFLTTIYTHVISKLFPMRFFQKTYFKMICFLYPITHRALQHMYYLINA